MTRPAPTSARGMAKARRKIAQLAMLAQAETDHDAMRAKAIAEDRPDPGPWAEYAAESDASSHHWGDPLLYVGAYTGEQFDAALGKLSAKNDARDAQRKAAPPMTPAQKAHVATFPKAGAVPTKTGEPTDEELDAMSDNEYREYLYGEMLKVEKTPAAMAARLDRIDRQRLKTGQTRQWSDKYRASKGLPAFTSTKRAGTGSTMSDSQIRAWINERRSELPASATDAELVQWVTDRKGSLPASLADKFGRPAFSG